MRGIMLVNENSIHLIRNDLNNNFNTIGTAHLEQLSKITNCTFCKKTKYLTFITNNQTIYQLRNFENKLSRGIKFTFPRAAHDAEEKIIIQHEYCSHYELLILLNNRN